MKKIKLLVAISILLVTNVVHAVDLSGLWIIDDDVHTLIRIYDDGISYQAIKLRGGIVVPPGSVTFFGTKSITNPICRVVYGNSSNLSSSLQNCTLTIIDNDNISTFSASPGSIWHRVKQTGSTAGMTVSNVSCKNMTTGITVNGTVYDSKQSSWSCDDIAAKKGDVIIQTIKGKAN